MKKTVCGALIAALPFVALAQPAPSSPGAPAELPPLDLSALLEEAMRGNPWMAAARSRASAAEAVPSRMEALPDPLASVSYTNESFSELTLGETPDSMLTFSWTQEVPYPGKLRLAGDAARREAEMSQSRAALVQWEISSRVKQVYADLYRIDRSVRILGESRELLTSFLETTRIRFETGEGLLQNVLKAQTEISKLDIELQKLIQERASAGATLSMLLGRGGDEPLGPAEALPDIRAVLDPPSIEREALARSPEILELQAALSRGEARLDLARRESRPDLVWGAAYTNRGSLDPMVMGMFGVKLPLYRDRKQAQGIVQAGHELEAAKLDIASVRLRVQAEVRELVARASRAEAIAELYEHGVMDQAQSALDSAAASYGVGRVDFLALLSDFTTLLGYEVDLESQRAERLSALAALERLVARPLVGPPGPYIAAPEEAHE